MLSVDSNRDSYTRATNVAAYIKGCHLTILATEVFCECSEVIDRWVVIACFLLMAVVFGL
jgi:hypothetical protein